MPKALQKVLDSHAKAIVKEVDKHNKGIIAEANKGKRTIAQYRRDVSRLASVANKRVDRLEKNGLQNNPAYKYFMEGGGKRFGVKGKTYNEVQAEMARLKRFVEMESSTIQGTKRVLKKMADNTGMKYKNMKELEELAPRFFELQSKAEQYIRNQRDAASAIGYQKMWEVINEAQEDGEIDLTDASQSVEEMIVKVDAAIQEYEEKRSVSSGLGTSFFNLLPDE